MQQRELLRLAAGALASARPMTWPTSSHAGSGRPSTARRALWTQGETASRAESRAGEQPAYLHRDARLPEADRRRELNFTPFDPVIWRRARKVARLFDFEYRVEIFVPKPKAALGEGILRSPILAGGSAGCPC